MNDRALSKDEIDRALKTSRTRSPSCPAYLVCYHNQRTGFVRIINAVPQGLVNVLQAKVREEGGNNA